MSVVSKNVVISVLLRLVLWCVFIGLQFVIPIIRSLKIGVNVAGHHCKISRFQVGIVAGSPCKDWISNHKWKMLCIAICVYY